MIAPQVLVLSLCLYCNDYVAPSYAQKTRAENFFIPCAETTLWDRTRSSRTDDIITNDDLLPDLSDLIYKGLK